jgi:isovaleryl-CoA dehydrogenase
MEDTARLSSDEIRALVEHASELFFDHLYPLHQRMDNEDWFPEQEFLALGQMGFLGITVPPEYGGQGLSDLAAGMLGEAMAKANPAVAWSWPSHDNLCLDALFCNGSETQRRLYIPGVCEGRLIGALAMTEPEAGTDKWHNPCAL